jgi:hypothetical protein
LGSLSRPAEPDSTCLEFEGWAAPTDGGDGGSGIPAAVLTKVLSRRIGGGCAARAAYDDDGIVADSKDDDEAPLLSRLFALPSAPPPVLPWLLLSPLLPGRGGGASFGPLPAMVKT